MPLHRNESSNEKTMTQKGQAVYVKENYMLSRERATVYTQLSTDPQNPMTMPEILFKGKGVRMDINPPQNMKVQFAPVSVLISLIIYSYELNICSYELKGIV